MFYGQEGDYNVILDGLGTRFEIVSVGPKPFPSCRYTHPAVTGVLALLREHSITADEIREIRVHIGERDMHSVGGWTEEEKKKKYRPEGIVDAQFSIPYTVAATLVNGRLSLEEFTDAELRNEIILGFASRVKPVLDRALDDWPANVKPQIIEIETSGRRVFTKRVDYPKGNPKNPVTSEELVESFRDMANYSANPLDRAKVDATIEAILGLEKAEDVSIVARLLTA